MLKGSFYDLPDIVLDRQEVFLCGPDAEGWAAGSTTMRPAKVDTGEHRAKEPVDRPVSRPQDLPGGPALVRFPNPVVDVVANIAATGVMWVAATHKDLLAVGVPRVKPLTHAVVLPHGVTQEGDPMSWLRRLRPQKRLGLP